MKLTVLVSVYNSSQWLENRLRNLLAVDMVADTQIWCLNAGSPDPRDDEICRDFGSQITYLRLDHHLDLYPAWNYIIENSESEFLTNANTDDLIAPQAYSTLIGALTDAGPEYGFAYPSWGNTGIPNQAWPPHNVDWAGRPGNYSGDINLCSCGHFPLWRRSLHAQFGLFDPRFKAVGDADWWARCHYLGKIKFLWVDIRLALYLWRDGANLWSRTISATEWELYHAKIDGYRNGVIS